MLNGDPRFIGAQESVTLNIPLPVFGFPSSPNCINQKVASPLLDRVFIISFRRSHRKSKNDPLRGLFSSELKE